MESRDAGYKRFVVSALCVFAFIAIFLGGCVPSATDEDPRPAPGQKDKVPTTARIVCDRDGTRVLTPRVAARPNGVHYTIDNRLGDDFGYSVEFTGGGIGDNAPKGESAHVGSFPPGEVRIGCNESMQDAEPDYASLRILEGNSGYRSTRLECGGGSAIAVSGGLLVPSAKGQKGDPVELARRALSERLEEGDVVEVAGYPERRTERSVRVVREDWVVAVVDYRREPSGWFQDSTSNCEAF